MDRSGSRVADARYVFLTAGSLEGEELFVSLEAVVEEMSDRLGYSVKIPSAIGGYTADLLLQAGDTTAAIGALRDLTEAYPGWESFRSRLEELTGG